MLDINTLNQINNTAIQNGCVIFGSDFICNFPINELAQNYRIDTPVYNRGINGLKINESEYQFDNSVVSLSPGKIFICIGENDVKEPDFDEKKFARQYDSLIKKMKRSMPAKIFIMSVVSAKQLDPLLLETAKNNKCGFIDISYSNNTYIDAFEAIRFYLRSRPLNFCDAMNLGR